jgi:hypothetical protein
MLWELASRSTDPPANFELIVLMSRKKKSSDKCCFPANYQQDIILDHYNYNDGISLLRNGNDLAYSKFRRAIKARCDVLQNNICWSPHSDWYLAVLTLASSNFYFLVQRIFDPYEQKGADSGDNRSRRTISRDLLEASTSSS